MTAAAQHSSSISKIVTSVHPVGIYKKKCESGAAPFLSLVFGPFYARVGFSQGYRVRVQDQGQPFRTAVPFWGQITWNLSGLSSERDRSPKWVKVRVGVGVGFRVRVRVMVRVRVRIRVRVMVRVRVGSTPLP